jgi:hypothetical protein
MMSMRSYYVEILIAQISAPPRVFILSRPTPPF